MNLFEVLIDKRSGKSLEIVIPTLNELTRLTYILPYYSKYFDVVILDSYNSEFDLIKLIESMSNVSLFKRKKDNLISTEKYFIHYLNNYSISKLCFYLFADEFTSLNDLKKIAHEFMVNKVSYVLSERIDWFYGRKVNSSGGIVVRAARSNVLCENEHSLHNSLNVKDEFKLNYNPKFIPKIEHLQPYSMGSYFNNITIYVVKEIEIFQDKNKNYIFYYRFVRRYIIPLLNWIIFKAIRDIQLGFSRLILQLIISCTVILIALANWIEKKYLMSSSEQAELYKKYFLKKASKEE